MPMARLADERMSRTFGAISNWTVPPKNRSQIPKLPVVSRSHARLSTFLRID